MYKNKKVTNALCLFCQDMLEVRYKLDSSQEAEVLRSGGRSLADGQLHSLHIRRLTDSVYVQVKKPPHPSLEQLSMQKKWDYLSVIPFS